MLSVLLILKYYVNIVILKKSNCTVTACEVEEGDIFVTFSFMENFI